VASPSRRVCEENVMTTQPLPMPRFHVYRASAWLVLTFVGFAAFTSVMILLFRYQPVAALEIDGHTVSGRYDRLNGEFEEFVCAKANSVEHCHWDIPAMDAKVTQH
jgi:hypothetical protein